MDWRKVKDYIEEEIDKIWLDEPLELTLPNPARRHPPVEMCIRDRSYAFYADLLLYL